MIGVKYDIIGDSGVMLHPSWDAPCVSRSPGGAIQNPAGWSPSVAELFQQTKHYMTATGSMYALAEGAATREGWRRMAQELWARGPET